MTIKEKPSAAQMLTRRINSTKRKPAETIEDEFAQAVAHRLESRGITTVPGLPQDEPPQWYDLAIERERRFREYEAKREAQRQAEEAARNEPQSTAGILAVAIAAQADSSPASKHIPLNGAAVLRAALAGHAGTINGQS